MFSKDYRQLNRLSGAKWFALMLTLIALATMLTLVCVCMPQDNDVPFALAEGKPEPTIVASSLVVDFTGKSHTIGEVTPVSVMCGESELIKGTDYIIVYKSDSYPESIDGPVNVGTYSVTIKIINETDYSYAEKTVQLTINKVNPNYTFVGTSEQQYGTFMPYTFTVKGVNNEFTLNPDVVYSFGDPAEVTPVVGTYSVTADYPGDSNYNPIHIDKELKVVKREVFVTFSGDSEFEYDGFAHTRTVTRTGVISADAETFKLVMKYNEEDEAINAGKYTISVDVNNSNYRIAKISGSTELVINKKQLTVSANAIQVSFGTEPEFVYTFSGFTFTDSEKNAIDKMPYVASCPTAIGEYDITPEGAEAKNYYFVYKPFKFTIYAIHFDGITDGVTQSNVTIDGVFKPDSKIYLMSYKSEDPLMDSFMEVLIADKQIISTNDVIYAYSLEFEEGGMVDDVATITISNVKFRPLFQTKLAVIDMKGNCHMIEKYTYDKETSTIKFQTHYVGTVFIYCNARLTYMVGGGIGVVVVIVVILLIAAEVLYRRRKQMHSMNIKPENEPTPYEVAHKKYFW